MGRLSFRIRNRGYTLIELMVVITIISILAGISLANFGQFQRNASDKVALSDYVNLKKVIYGAISESEDSPYYLFFNLEGERRLPVPLEQGVLSSDVRAPFVMRLPLFGGREVLAFEVNHNNGRYRYRYIEINGNGNDQVIEIR
jgi:prepilin-type N-terminal cleavage/methylation domain-containing protein